jgi:hypothetical protein
MSTVESNVRRALSAFELRQMLGGLAKTALELTVNFVLPLLIYRVGKGPLGDVHALMISAAPPLLWTIAGHARNRRIDALSLVALTGVGLSLLAFLGGGGVELLQLRERLVLPAIGLVFLGSAAIGKPLIYQLARARIRRRSPAEADAFEKMRDAPRFRRAMMIMTLVWGFGLLIDTALSASLIFLLTVDENLVVGPILGYGFIGGLTAWTFWYARRNIRAIRRDAGERAQS